MADVNALTYATLQKAVLGKRFPASQLADAKRWLAVAYNDVWGAFNWPFKDVDGASLTVSAGVQPTVPSDFADANDVRDQYGSVLERLDERTFGEQYGDLFALSLTGQPETYTVVNRQILLGPLPSVTATFTLNYRRRLAHRDTNGLVVVGMMSADTDYPLWDDHHGLLIPRAQTVGLQELNDPTFQMALDEYQRQLSRMEDDYRPARLQKQWPRQPRYA